MDSSSTMQSKFVNALRTQGKADYRRSGPLPCPYPGHHGRMFQNIDQLYDHAKDEHTNGIETHEPRVYRRQLEQAALELRKPVNRPLSTTIIDTARVSREPLSTESLSHTPGQFRPSPVQFERNVPKVQSPQRQPGLIELQKHDPRYPGLLLQPDSRPISQEQLASEVKSIYAGLTMVETKCIHVDRAQAAAYNATPDKASSEQRLASDHWQALIALHRTLLHEHHDFFLASQHPLASPALRRLAAKYSMPARMWKHGIHSFLELLRRRLPDSIDYMLAFIYLAYQMMALLYETVPAFEDTWIECLGDLGRYRMAIEDEDIRDREIWASVARSWYTKAADKNPSVGRLYHHLAILAQPNALQQLYYYARSLSCHTYSLNARKFASLHVRKSISNPWQNYIADIEREIVFRSRRKPRHVRLGTDIYYNPLIELHPSDGFEPVRRARSFFKKGRILTTFWPEPEGFSTGSCLHTSSFVVSKQNTKPSTYLHSASEYYSWATTKLGEAFTHQFGTARGGEITGPLSERFGKSEPRFNPIELVCSFLNRHTSAIATSLYAASIPTAFAATDPVGSSTPEQHREPIFRFETAFDFAMLGVMALYLVVVLILRLQSRYYSTAFHVSYALMSGTGLFSYVVNRDEFASSIRSTVIEAWFVFTCHVVVQYSYDNYNLSLHIISFFVLAIFPGAVILQYPNLGPLDILPPYVSCVALAALAVRELRKLKKPRQSLSDVENSTGSTELNNRASSAQHPAPVNTGHQDDPADPPEGLTRRNSNMSHN